MRNPPGTKTIFLLGLILSLSFSFAFLKYELEKENLLFQTGANNIFNKIEASFTTLERVNEELGALFYQEGEIDKDEFEFFAQSHLRQNPFIVEIIYAERVAQQDKPAYEKNLRDQGYTGFLIKPFPDSEINMGAKENPLFPIRYITPYTVKNSIWFGRDLLTHPSIRSAILSTQQQPGKLILTPTLQGKHALYAIRLLQIGNNIIRGQSDTKNIFGILLYMINPDFLIPDNSDDNISITLNGSLIAKNGDGGPDNLMDVAFSERFTIALSNQAVGVHVTRAQSIFQTSLLLPFFVFFIGLIVTLLVLKIILSHKRINTLLTNQNDIIEKEVERKTDELLEKTEKLSEAYQRQLELTDELEAFCYSVSHDLRAPLRSINGFSQILQDEYTQSLDDEALSYLSRTTAAAKKMGSIIDDLLNLSRITRASLKRRTTNLSRLVRNATLTMREYQPNTDISINIHDDVIVQGDEKLLQLAMDNLISNAWKYSGNNPHPEITFGLSHEGNRPVYFIRDNGIGFNMKYKDKLFTAFQRLHKDSQFEGTGIGLAIVERIIHKHNGQIWALSEPGQGSTFFFTLGEAAAETSK
ncbi:MAG TPA: hypothetical protein ENI97_02785 [Gammaproteobacteria bacterium]|nr:hypothetical protein [Gammaproteobacteria bacterium]